MKYIKELLISTILLSGVSVNASVNMSLNNADIKDLIQSFSKIEGKNILYSDDISFKVNFIQNKKFKNSDLKIILETILNKNGYSLVNRDSFYEIKKTELNNIKNVTKGLDTVIYKVYSFKNLNLSKIVFQIKPLLNKDAKIKVLKEENKLLIFDTLRKQNLLNDFLTKLDKESVIFNKKIKIEEQNSKDIIKLLKNMEKELNKSNNPNRKVTFFDYGDTNSIFINSKSKDRINYYEGIIKNLDIKTISADFVMEIVFLKNASSMNIESILKNLINNTMKTQSSNKLKMTPYKKGNNKERINSNSNLFSNDSNLKDFFITKDETLNAIILKGKKSNVESIKNIIERLDIPKKQVYVKATVIEVQDNNTDTIGIRYGLDGFNLTDNGLITLGSTLTGQSIATQIFSELGDTSSYSNSKGMALGFSLDFLKKNGALEILSEPSILCVNNKESNVKVVETIPVLTSTTVQGVGGSVSSSYTREDIGISLKVKPQLSNDKKVTLEVEAILEGVVSEGIEVGTPTTTKREVQTTAILKDGESVILGGLIRNDQYLNISKIPILGDIPLIGEWLFTSTSQQNKKTSLIIILTPYIIDETSSLNELRTKLIKLSYIQNEYNEKMQIEIKKKYTKKKEEMIEEEKDPFNMEMNDDY